MRGRLRVIAVGTRVGLAVWVGHSCPTLLILRGAVALDKNFGKQTAQASDLCFQNVPGRCCDMFYVCAFSHCGRLRLGKKVIYSTRKLAGK